MRFAEEFWLYLVPLVPMLWFVFRVADRRTNRRLISLLGPQAGTHIEGLNLRLQSWRRFFFLAGLFWLLLALARPQWGADEVTVTQRGSDIVIALDISNSMLAEDVLPNRMGRAVTELTSFLNRLEESRVGLVFFAGSAFVQCPLTLDYGTAEIFLKMAGPDMMSEQGTAIAAALETSRKLLGKDRQGGQKNNFQAILLVTDGEDLEGDWESQAESCKSEGIKVIPVGVGDKGGGLIPVLDAQGRPDGFMKDEEGNVVMTRLDLASLEKMAGIGGGSSFLVGVDGLAGDRLFAELQRLGKRDLEDRRIASYTERYFWPLMLAVICFALRLFLHGRRPNRPRRHEEAPFIAAGVGPWVLILVLPLFWSSEAAAVLRPVGGDEAMAGREHYLTGDFEKALDKFEEALIQAPEDPLISLALGETLFQLERYEEAGVEFERALDLSEDPTVKAEALYNRGTSHLAAGETDLAIEDLLASLQWDPDQPDARHNLEIGLRRLEQEQQQEQDQEEQGEDQDQQDEEQEKQDQQEQQENQEDQENQENQEQQDENQQEEEQDQDQQEQEQQEQEQQEQEQQESQENPEEMTQEQALQLLKALDRDEEELKRSVQKRLRGGRPKSGKKW